MSAAFPPAIPRSVAALDPAVQGVILAGGRATRMGGGDKALRTLAGRPMLAHLIERFAPQLPKGESDLVLNANGDPARFASYGLEVVADQVGEDAEAREGPLAGILAGLERAAARGRPFLATAAADTPFPPRRLVDALRAVRRAEDLDVVFAATRRPGADRLDLHPTFGLWRVELAADLRRMLETERERKVLAFAERYEIGAAEFENPDPETGLDPFFNVNRPEDLAAAEIAALRLAGAAS